MKNKNYLFSALFLVLSLLGCSKDDNVEIYEKGKQEFGFGKAKKNGCSWEASGQGFFSKKDKVFSVGCKTYNTKNEIRENLAFLFPAKIGKSELNEEYIMAYTRREADGDVIFSRYKIDTDETNYIEITKIDEVNKVIKGNFCGYFKKDWGPDEYPAKIRFTKGCFEVKYEDF